jgi:hypothetical protein
MTRDPILPFGDPHIDIEFPEIVVTDRRKVVTKTVPPLCVTDFPFDVKTHTVVAKGMEWEPAVQGPALEHHRTTPCTVGSGEQAEPNALLPAFHLAVTHN